MNDLKKVYDDGKRKEKEGNIVEEMDRTILPPHLTLHRSRTSSFYNNYERLIKVYGTKKMKNRVPRQKSVYESRACEMEERARPPIDPPF